MPTKGYKLNKYGNNDVSHQMQYKPTTTQGDTNTQYDNLITKSSIKKSGTLNGGRKKSRTRIHRRKTHKKIRTNRRK